MAARARGRAAARPWLLACRPRALLAAAALAVCCGRLRRGCALAGAGAPRASSAAGAVRGARPHAGAGPRGVAAAAGLAAAREPSQQWGGLTPQGPYFRGGRRKTILRDLVPGQVWSLEQVQGVIYVHVPVRMALVRTSVGLVGYSAVAPTEEMLQLLSRIEEAAGERLAHLILPTTAAEHKLFAVALAQARSDLEFWIVPGQFAFPLNLPNELLGFPIGRTRPLPAQCSDTVAPWAAELPYRVLGPFPSKDGVSTFEELCAFHPASKTLLCVDLVVSVPSDPPSILLANDPRALWWHARTVGTDGTANAQSDAAYREEREREGWQKIALFALYFQSGALDVANEPDGSLAGASAFFSTAFPSGVSDATKELGWGSFYPFTWKPSWRASFDALRCDGALLVPPILAVLILNRRTRDVLDFVDDVCESFPFERVVPCHFSAPVDAAEGDLRDAFSFLRDGGGDAPPWARWPPWRRRRLGEQPPADLAFLRGFERQLVDLGSIFPAAPKAPR